MQLMANYSEKQRASFSKRLNEALDKAGFPVRGRAPRIREQLPFDITIAGIRKWLEGESIPTTSRLSAIAKIANTTSERLISSTSYIHQRALATPLYSDEYDTSKHTKTINLLPLITWEQSANWSDTVSSFDIEQAISWLPCHLKHSNTAYALTIRGSSMAPLFVEGDVIFVDPEREAKHNSYVIAKLEKNHEAIIRKLMIEGEQKYLQADNPNWPERIIKINDSATICGVVIFKGLSFI